MTKRTHVAAASAAAILFLSACGEDPTVGADGGIDPLADAGTDAGEPGDGGMPPVSCTPSSLPPLAQGSWDPDFTLAGFTGQDGLSPKVFDFAQTADGDLLATGYFSYLGGERVDPLVRRHDGNWEPARNSWELPVPPAGFSAVTTGPGNELALATWSSLGLRHGEVWVDTGEGLKAIGHFEGLVRTMVWFDEQLWVAGNFQLSEANTAPYLAVWNGSAWGPPPGGAVDGPVYALRIEGNKLLAGGYYSAIGGISARNVAEWDGTDWSAYDFDLSAGTVYTLARDSSGELYAGGTMFNDPDTALGGIARWTGTGWELVGGGVSNGFIPGVVSDLVPYQGNLYVTGCFRSLGGTPEDSEAVPANSLARWTGTAWEAVGDPAGFVNTPWFNPTACGDEGPFAVWDMDHQRLFNDGTHLLIGGSFTGQGGVVSHGAIAWDGEKFIAQGEAGQGIAGAPEDVAVGGPECAIYAVGQMSHAGGRPAPGVARYHNGWTSMGPLPSGETCSEIAANDAGDVFLGCYAFTDTSLDGHVYRFEGEDWVRVGGALPEGLVMDLAIAPDGKLWVAGGAETGYVARLDGDAFTVVEDGFDAIVSHIAFRQLNASSAPVEFVVGGAFGNIGSEPFARLARWNGQAWEPVGPGVSSSISALEYGVDAIYVGTQDEGNPDRITLGKWNGTAWEELATPERELPAPMGGSVHTFLGLREIGGQLIAAGYVWPETGGRNVYLYDGQRFTPIGGGANAIMVDAVAVSSDGLWFAGSIADVGTGNDRIPSVGMAHYRFGPTP